MFVNIILVDINILKIMNNKKYTKKSNALKKLWKNPEYRKNQVEKRLGKNNPFYGKTHSKEFCELQRERGKKRMQGKKQTSETKIKIGIANKGKNNGQWDGDNVGYQAIHIWIRSNKPKSKYCEYCSQPTTKLEAANISGKYKRDINDFLWLCLKCHKWYDSLKPKSYEMKLIKPKKRIKK